MRKTIARIRHQGQSISGTVHGQVGNGASKDPANAFGLSRNLQVSDKIGRTHGPPSRFKPDRASMVFAGLHQIGLLFQLLDQVADDVTAAAVIKSLTTLLVPGNAFLDFGLG